MTGHGFVKALEEKMNEEQEALWILIHARICYALASKNPKYTISFKLKELLLLKEQMPNLLAVNQDSTT